MASSAVAILSSSESLPTKPATPAWVAAHLAAGIRDHQDGRARALVPDRPGRADAIPAFVETEIEQARVGLVPDHRGHALVGGRGDGQRLMTARLERDRKRFAENTIIVTQN